jgi:hypothetical protein
MIHHCIDAHCATDSSGFTVAFGSLSKISLINLGTKVILVEPQTNIISFMSLVLNLES